MIDLASHPLPRPAAVFSEQLRVVGLAVRREAAVLAGVLLLVSLAALLESWEDGQPLDGMPVPPVIMIFLGALTPFAVWKGERVFGGGHLWTLPVGRRQHALTKVLAGGVWVFLAVAALQLWIIGLALATGGSIGEDHTRMLVGPGGAADLTPVRWTTPAWEWLRGFTVALTCYLIGSAFMLGVRYPLRWGAAAVAAFFGLGMLAESGVTRGFAERAFYTVAAGPLGVGAARGGGDSEETDTPMEGREDLDTEVLVLWRRLPSFEEYWPAALLWAGLGGAALAIAASRHRERGGSS